MKKIIFVFSILLIIALTGCDNENLTEKMIRENIDAANYCDTKEDCVDAGSKCPFGCYSFVNKAEVESIQKIISEYHSECVYGCMIIEGVECVNNKCQEILPEPGKESDIMTGNLCEGSGGHWNTCSNRCQLDNQGNENAACNKMCEQLCECGGIAGFSCPEGYICKVPDGVVDALGYCENMDPEDAASESKMKAEEIAIDHIKGFDDYKANNGRKLEVYETILAGCPRCFSVKAQYYIDSIKKEGSVDNVQVEMQIIDWKVFDAVTSYRTIEVPEKYEIAEMTGEECSENIDCETPMDYLIRSNCPYGSLCIEGECAVICPEY